MLSNFTLLWKQCRLMGCALVLMAICTSRSYAQTTLSAGDIAFVSFDAGNTQATDTFSFVLMVNISAGTTINFTDRGYTTSGTTFIAASAQEGTISWASGTALAAGTEVMITNLQAFKLTPPSTYTANGTVTKVDGTTTLGMDLRGGGDQILAFQGTLSASSATYTMISGLNYNNSGTTDAAWDAGVCGTSACSNMPPGLTGNTTAQWMGTIGGVITNSGKFNCTGTPYGTAANLRTAIYTLANWSRATDQAISVPCFCTFLGAAPAITTQPNAASKCAGSTATFTAAASNAVTYKWQVSSGGAYSDITDNATYSGSATTTLSVVTAAGLNGYNYKMNAINGGSNALSNAATLTVVTGSPTVNTHPSMQFACPSGNTSFTAAATNGTVTYKWQVDNGAGGGFVDISNGGVYSNATTATLNITGATTSMYGYDYRAVATNECGSTNSNSATLTLQNTWTGTSNTLWNNTANWSCGVIPDANTDVIINSTANSPVLNVTGAVHNMTIGTGALFSIAANMSFTITGDVTNNGTYAAANSGATTSLISNAAQTIPSGTYANLTINGGSNKSLGGNITVNGVLTMTSGKIVLGNNVMTMASTSSSTGLSSTNYIVTNGNGGVKRMNMGSGGFTGTFVFAIGTATTYTPMALSNAGTADNFTARVIDNVYANYISDVPQGAPLTNKVVKKTWFVDEDIVGNSNATLTVQWNTADQGTSFNTSSITLSHYVAGAWQTEPLHAAIGSNPYTIARAGITSFSPFGVGNGGSPLPVSLQHFDGAYSAGKVTLDWTVAQETGIHHYDVTRSENAATFEKVGESITASNSLTTHKYNFIDAPVKTNTTYYYRLNIVNQDGTTTYSPVVKINTGNKADYNVTLLNNPAKNNIELNVTSFQQETANIRITDLVGRTIFSKAYTVQNGSQVISVPTATLAANKFYLVKMSINNQSYEFKVLIN